MCDLVLSALDRPVDPELDDLAAAKDPVEVGDRRDVFEVLVRGEITADEAKLTEAVERALRDDGKFVPPLLLVDGEVRLPFDELAVLKATLSIVSRFAPGDEPLEAAIAEARELLRTPDLMCPPGMFEELTTLVQEAFRKSRRAAPPAGYLEEQTERALLARRCYQRRDIVGGAHVRALLELGSAPRPLPLYLPEAAAPRLPMFTRFHARILCEAYLQEDQFEAQPIALRAAALARLTPMEARGARS